MDELGIFNNRYQILAKIGQGGLAEVYRAQDVALGRLVAVKALRREYVVDPAFLVRFHREAQSAAGLSHTNIVSVYDFGQDQGRPYIVMEYVPGQDLRSLLRDDGALSVARMVDIALQICAGVGYAHRSGLVHGDIKPGNVLIAPDGRVKVADFGLARALGESAMDEDGELVWGTPAYFAPEQAMGAEVVPATDVYAIGVILYEMLTGQLPFTGTDSEVSQKHLYETPVPANKVNPRVPAELSRIIDRAMLKQPDARFANAEQMGLALNAYRRQAEGQTGGYAAAPRRRPQATGRRASQPKPRSRSGPDWIGLTLGLLAVVALLGLVPLWVSVLRSYLQQPSASSPTPTVTLAADQVRVPDVVGMEVEDAERVLQDAGLQLEVQGEASHPTIPAFAVISQSVRAGMPVNRDSLINVVVSQGPDLVEVPALTGSSLGSAQAELQTLGLISQARQVWSLQSPGTVTEQDPPAGSLVQARSLVVLSVSSGTQVPVGARLGSSILLVAYDLPEVTYKSGETVPLRLVWQATAAVVGNYNVFVHLTDAEGRMVAQHDSVPDNGQQPTGGWALGRQVSDPHDLNIPQGLAGGQYQIWIGMYDEAGRLNVTDAGPLTVRDNALLLTSIEIN